MLSSPTTARGRFGRIVLIVVLLILFSSQLVHAQDPNPSTGLDENAPTQSVNPNAPQVISDLKSCTGRADTWETTSTSLQIIAQCTIDVPAGGFVFMNATASVVYNSDNVQGSFQLALNENVLDQTVRKLDIYTDTLFVTTTGDGSDKVVATSMRYWVDPGLNTFYFLGKRLNGPGTIQLADANLTVLYHSASSSNIDGCDAFDAYWSRTGITYDPVLSCSLNTPKGYVYIKATSNVDSDYTDAEGQFQLFSDSDSIAESKRVINIYYPNYSVPTITDESLSTMAFIPVTAGNHSYSLRGLSIDGNRIQLNNTTLTVIYFPEALTLANICYVKSTDTWTNMTNTFTPILSCSNTTPTSAIAIMDASGQASLGGVAQPWEAQYRIGVDNNGQGSIDYNRWINIYPDTDYNASGNGTDWMIADNGAFFVSAGQHTYYFVGRRFAGTGTATFSNTSLFILMIPTQQTYAPIVMK